MLLNFKLQFVEPIRLGIKAHTIRGDRKDGYVPKPGEPLYLYCGARTKKCFKILEEPPPCTKVFPITIRVKFIKTALELVEEEVCVSGDRLIGDELDRLAKSDGFPDWNQMRWFWIKEHGETRRAMGSSLTVVNFKGNIIHWRPPCPARN